MAQPSPDRALRREIARLARRHPSDVELILADLDPGERVRVQALLREYLRPDTSRQTYRATASSLSPWLIGRSEGKDGDLTVAVRQLLRDCAAPVSKAVPGPMAGNKASLVERGLAALARKRPA